MFEYIIQIILAIGISSVVFYFFNKPKKIYIVDHDYGWLDIKKHPIPDDDIFYKYIATDGKKVKAMTGFDYNKKGDLFLCSYDKTLIKFWMPYHQPPK